jgi:hypothetical protein
MQIWNAFRLLLDLIIFEKIGPVRRFLSEVYQPIQQFGK